MFAHAGYHLVPAALRAGCWMMDRSKDRDRILLVDDQDAVRELVAMTLGDDKFELLDAADGETALRMARSFRPHLILLDVGIPRLDGFSVCRALKRDGETKHIPVIMLTAAGGEADRAAGEAAGADDYFTKPFSPSALVKKVHEVLKDHGQGSWLSTAQLPG